MEARLTRESGCLCHQLPFLAQLISTDLHSPPLCLQPRQICLTQLLEKPLACSRADASRAEAECTVIAAVVVVSSPAMLLQLHG